MKVAIFENEFETVEMAFKYANKKYYSDSIQFENYPRSDSISDIRLLLTYDLIVIDLDLSSRSQLDGFGLIKSLESLSDNIPPILILTGQSLTSNYPNQNGLKKSYPILEKPINFKLLFEKFKELGLSPSI